MTKKENEDFEGLTKCWICGNNYTDNDVELRDYCHMTGKYRGSAHRVCHINLKLNNKIPVVFHNLRSCNQSFSSYYARTRQVQS